MAEYEKSIPFKNWTTEDFQGVFGAAIVSPPTTTTENHTAELLLDKPYLFKAGGTYSVPQSQALHFARQLAVRELHRTGTAKGEMLAENDVTQLMDKCFPVKPSDSATTNTFERLDEPSQDVPAKASPKVKENKTDADVQNEDDDEDDTVTGEKNGSPKFKDKKYVKA